MAGLGYRREMADWDMAAVNADFFEVVPENWVRRDRSPLHQLIALGRPVHLHGVSLNLGGSSVIDQNFLKEIRGLIDDLGAVYYSDHLAASGDAHQLYDLFPIPFTPAEVRRVADRISRVQDILGRQIGIENTTWYTNIGDIKETEFISLIADRADCHILLDLNNITVNHKNHGGDDLESFVAKIDFNRVMYMHVAGHEFDERFGMYIDTHSQPVEGPTAELACSLCQQHGIPLLLEWDNELPTLDAINRELACLSSFTTT